MLKPMILFRAAAMRVGVAVGLALGGAAVLTATASVAGAPQAQAFGLSDIGSAIENAGKMIERDMERVCRAIDRGSKWVGNRLGVGGRLIGDDLVNGGRYIGMGLTKFLPWPTDGIVCTLDREGAPLDFKYKPQPRRWIG